MQAAAPLEDDPNLDPDAIEGGGLPEDAATGEEDAGEEEAASEDESG